MPESFYAKEFLDQNLTHTRTLKRDICEPGGSLHQRVSQLEFLHQTIFTPCNKPFFCNKQLHQKTLSPGNFYKQCFCARSWISRSFESLTKLRQLSQVCFPQLFGVIAGINLFQGSFSKVHTIPRPVRSEVVFKIWCILFDALGPCNHCWLAPLCFLATDTPLGEAWMLLYLQGNKIGH